MCKFSSIFQRDVTLEIFKPLRLGKYNNAVLVDIEHDSFICWSYHEQTLKTNCLLFLCSGESSVTFDEIVHSPSKTELVYIG